MNFLPKFDRRGPYKNNEDFVLCLIVLSKHFLAKLFIPLIKRSAFSTILSIFWKIEFLTEIHQARTLQKWWKFLYYLKLWKENIFWLNYLFHSSKERFLQKIRQLLENWIFCWNSTGADLTKIVKILYYLKLWKDHIFAILFISLIKRKVSTKN